MTPPPTGASANPKISATDALILQRIDGLHLAVQMLTQEMKAQQEAAQKMWSGQAEAFRTALQELIQEFFISLAKTLGKAIFVPITLWGIGYVWTLFLATRH